MPKGSKWTKRELATERRFGGKFYTIFRMWATKRLAEKDAAKLRAKGHRVRVVKTGTGYSVYKRYL